MANWLGLDGTQTICILCYSALVGNSEQVWSNAVEKVRQPPLQTRQSPISAQRPVQVKQRPAQAKRQSSRKARPEQTKERPPPPVGGKLRRQFPGLESLIAFLRTAGVSVEVVRGRYRRIDGIQTEPLSHLPQQETLEWNSVVNKIVLEYLRSKFVRAVEDNTCFGEGLRVVLQAREKGFVVIRDDVRLATIHASRAEIPHREAIHANFLVPGPHWRLLAEIVQDTESQLTAERKQEQDARTAAEAAAAAAQAERRRAANRRRIDHLPDDLAPELIDACLDASRRIRLERQVAYERPVTLEFDAKELTLLPITRTATHPLLPFRLSTAAQTLNGQLVLADCEPLPLLIDADIADTDAITAWTCALAGFADATCIEFNSAAPASRSEPTRSRWPRPLYYPTIVPRCRPCRESSHGRATLRRLATGSATAARSFQVTGGASMMAGPPATRPVTGRVKSVSSCIRTRPGSGRTPAASPTASKCASFGTHRPSSNVPCIVGAPGSGLNEDGYLRASADRR
jgi:hypothetical protein